MDWRRSSLRIFPVLGVAVGLAGWSATDAYIRAVAAHFEVPVAEVQVLADWNLPLEEVPVVLFLAQRSGVSPDALIAIRRGGSSWIGLAERYGLDAGAFHFSMDRAEAGDLLGDVHERFRTVPQSEWRRIRLSDREVVSLVNVRFLSQVLRVVPGRVVEARMRSGDFVEAYGALLRAD